MKIKPIIRLLLILNIFYFSAYSHELSEKETAQFNKYYSEATELMKPYMIFDATKASNGITPAAKHDLKKSLVLLRKAIKINPDSWQTQWLIGKAYQAFWELNESYEWFRQAYLNEPNNPEVANEYMMSLIALDRNEDGLKVAQTATKKFPSHIALRANYGLALLLNRRIDEAQTETQKALALKPDDLVTKKLLNFIEKVKSGKQPCPKTYWEMVLSGQ